MRRLSVVADDAPTGHLPAEACSALRLDSAWHLVRRPARQALLKVARHVPMAVAAFPEVRVAEVEAVVPLRADRPEATASLRQVAVLLQAAKAPSSARSAAVVGRKARRSAVATTSVVEAAAVPAEELDAVVATAQPQVAAHAAGLRPAAECAVAAGEAAAVLAVAAVLLLAAGAELDAAAVPLREVAAELDEAVPLLAAVRVGAAERRRAALDGVAARREAVASVFRLGRLLPWLGPQQAARSAHALRERSTASP